MIFLVDFISCYLAIAIDGILGASE
jgi:hypothetical protein